MKSILALAAASLLALSAPAFAQSAGSPSATGTGGSLTGSNPGTGYGSNGPIGDSINPGAGPAKTMHGHSRMHEGRAAAKGHVTPGDKANLTPKTVRGTQHGQKPAK